MGAFNTLKTLLESFLNESKKKFQKYLYLLVLIIKTQTFTLKSFETIARELPECPTMSMFRRENAPWSSQNSLEERIQT